MGNEIKNYFQGSLLIVIVCPIRLRIHMVWDVIMSPDLYTGEASYLQSIIEKPSWVVAPRRVNRLTEVALLLSHLTLPREGHMHAA